MHDRINHIIRLDVNVDRDPWGNHYVRASTLGEYLVEAVLQGPNLPASGVKHLAMLLFALLSEVANDNLPIKIIKQQLLFGRRVVIVFQNSFGFSVVPLG